jgi:hypothetical protein
MLAANGAIWADGLFWLGLSILLAHELDAVRAREWRLLFVLRRMPEELARDAFVLVHVPLVGVLLWLFAHAVPEVRLTSQAALDVFLIAHAGIHYRLAGHALYGFQSRASRSLIFGGAVVGMVHLVMLAALAMQG